MLIADIPTKFNIPFANAAGPTYTRVVPQASQIGIQAGAASLTDGFPPVCFLPIGAGGTPPWGADFNGLLNQISAWARWGAAGGPINFDAAFQTAISGYPKGALIQSLSTFGKAYLSGVDNNTTDPDAGGANWYPIGLIGGTMTAGAWTWRPTAETVSGWVKANGTTIGNASSNATQRANADTFDLYVHQWTNFSNTQCPIYTSIGTPTTRGASAAADFAANKAIAVFNMAGYGIGGMDTMGGAPTTILSGVPAVTGSRTQAGSILGENFHALIIAELAAHNHGVTDSGHVHGVNDPGHSHGNNISGGVLTTAGGTTWNAGGVGGTNQGLVISAALTAISIASNVTGISINNAGSGTAHNTYDQKVLGTHYFKL